MNWVFLVIKAVPGPLLKRYFCLGDGSWEKITYLFIACQLLVPVLVPKISLNLDPDERLKTGERRRELFDALGS